MATMSIEVEKLEMDLPPNSTLLDITDTLATWNHRFCRHLSCIVFKATRKFFFTLDTEILS